MSVPLFIFIDNGTSFRVRQNQLLISKSLEKIKIIFPWGIIRQLSVQSFALSSLSPQIILLNGYIAPWSGFRVVVRVVGTVLSYHGLLVPLLSSPYPLDCTMQWQSKPISLRHTLSHIYPDWYSVDVARYRWLSDLIGTGMKTALLYPVSYQLQWLLIVTKPPVKPMCH
jgi:hypothetical protein